MDVDKDGIISQWDIMTFINRNKLSINLDNY